MGVFHNTDFALDSFIFRNGFLDVSGFSEIKSRQSQLINSLNKFLSGPGNIYSKQSLALQEITKKTSLFNSLLKKIYENHSFLIQQDIVGMLSDIKEPISLNNLNFSPLTQGYISAMDDLLVTASVAFNGAIMGIKDYSIIQTLRKKYLKFRVVNTEIETLSIKNNNDYVKFLMFSFNQVDYFSLKVLKIIEYYYHVRPLQKKEINLSGHGLSFKTDYKFEPNEHVLIKLRFEGGPKEITIPSIAVKKREKVAAFDFGLIGSNISDFLDIQIHHQDIKKSLELIGSNNIS